MKNKKSILAAGALLCSTFAGTVSPISSVFAEGASSMFDLNAQACIINNYNATNDKSVSTIEEVNFDDVTALNCPNYYISNIRGIVLFKNLKELNLSGNGTLDVYSLDFSQNTKLESLNLSGTNAWNLDLSHNPDLTQITVGPNTVGVTLAQGVERLDDGKYGIKLDNYRWYSSDTTDPYTITIDESLTPYTLDEETNRIIFNDKTKIPYAILFSNSRGNLRVNTRSGWMRYAIFLNGDEAVEPHNPFYVNNNCKEEDGYYYCDNSIYSGDTFDTEDIVENTLAKIFNLSAYKLSEVKIVPPKANIELTTDTDTVKKGVALADADFTFEFHFDLDVKTPETGSSTSEGNGNIATISTSIIVGIVVSLYTFFFLFKRQKQSKH